MKDTDLIKELSRLGNAIERIAVPVPAIPAIPAIPPIVANGDHDLLTSFRAESLVEFKNIKDTLVKMQDAFSNSPTRAEHTEVLRVQADHEARMRLQESFRDTLMGKMIALGSLSGLVTGIIILLINHFWR